MIKKYFLRAGIDSSTYGSRIIRHSFATQLVNQNTSIKTISEAFSLFLPTNFKNYENTINHKGDEVVKIFYKKEALLFKDENDSEFQRRLYQLENGTENKQLSLHLKKLVNSLYFSKL